MSGESSLALVSLFLTYLFKATAVYVCLSLLSRLIRNSQIRFWLYGLFLVGAVTSWLYLFLSRALRLPPLRTGTAATIVSSTHFSWSLNAALLPGLAKSLSYSPWWYATILALLLGRFCAGHWQLRNFLRSSEPSPDSLSFLFELVRSRGGAPRCEFRIVEDLRSPATTGWWHPKVLLPRQLLRRLDSQQLVHVLQHELMHVRRRDFLWDRLSTLGCCIIFFHPAAWLARNRLRWERELVCDEGVVEGSGDRRLEYASCLTTLASWWFLGEQTSGQVDFLSSPPSLLTARVRALLRPPSSYGSCKKTAFTMLTSGALVVAALLIPNVAVTAYRLAPSDVARNDLQPHSKRVIGRVKRGHVAKARKGDAVVLPAAAFASSAAPPTLNIPVVLPRLSSYEGGLFEGSPRDSASETPAAGDVRSIEGLQADAKIWDESLPQAPRSRASKIGSVALRVLKFGIGVAASQIGDHEHEKEH
jgi:beta-lactamase regulating signal transducer with metallopeptidase domain